MFTVDTGADVSTLTEHTSNELGLKLEQPEHLLMGADGTNLNVLGVCEVSVNSTYCSVDTLVYVLKDSNRNLLGVPALKELNLLAVVNAICISEFEPASMIPQLFSTSGAKVKPGLNRDGKDENKRGRQAETDSEQSWSKVQRPSPSIVDKVDNFLNGIQPVDMLTLVEIERRKAKIVQKYQNIHDKYKYELSSLDKEARRLNRLINQNQALQKAMVHIANLRNAIENDEVYDVSNLSPGAFDESFNVSCASDASSTPGTIVDDPVQCTVAYDPITYGTSESVSIEPTGGNPWKMTDHMFSLPLSNVHDLIGEMSMTKLFKEGVG